MSGPEFGRGSWRFPHMCQDEHPRIGHATDEEMCPVCLAQSALLAAEQRRDEYRREWESSIERENARMTDLAALREQVRVLETDRARMDWLNQAVPSGDFRRLTGELRGVWNGDFRSWVDAAIQHTAAARRIVEGT